MIVFNIPIEFDHDRFREIIGECVDNNNKGYICVVDANVLTISYDDEEYSKVINGALTNTCDGSSIAVMANLIYGTKFTAFNGPDLFNEYIEKEKYTQLLIGNTQEKYNQIINTLQNKGKNVEHMAYMPLPFADIDSFDYQRIAEKINSISPDLVWVSLGAPKQEFFMSRLLPYLNSGVLFGIGAAFNFYVGDIIQPAFHIGSFRFIWLDRIFREPKKQLKRILTILSHYPLLFISEVKKAHRCSK